MDTAELCVALMRADTENEVVRLLTRTGYWGRNEYWRPIGDMENNFGTIGNQQSDAVAALAEKIVNSIDARLTDACLLARIDPSGPSAPRSIREAVAQFFEGRQANSEIGGRIHEWSNSKATDEGRLLTVTATGAIPGSGSPSITIADKGEGQTPDDFPTTFMSLARSNKLRIPFVQGKFNMGGTGSLQFCGDAHGFQLVVSRRNPALLKTTPVPRDREWGFTIVRREPPIGGRRNSVFTYLAPVGVTESRDGNVLSFSADTLPIFPESDRKVRDAYSRHSSYGSLVKLYEYNWRGSGSVSHVLRRGGLMRRIETALPEVALPVRFFECRQEYGGGPGSYDNNALGILTLLELNRAENLESDPFGGPINLEGRTLPVQIFVFKPDRSQQYRTQKHGVIFTVNGQTHGSLRTDFFRRNSVGMSYLAESLLVVVDCSAIDGTMREDLFMNSRDRLRDNQLSGDLEVSLQRYLRNHPKLRELRNKRQEAMTKKRLEADKPLIEALESVLKHDPTLSWLLLEGLGISSPFAPGGGVTPGVKAKFVGKKFPTFFRFRNLSDGETLSRDAHLGSGVRVAFETDAVDDYFSRTHERGTWAVDVRSNGRYSAASNWAGTGPNSGVAHLWFDALPANVKIGDQIDCRVRVTDPNRFDEFVNILELHVKGPQRSTPGGRRRRRSAGNLSLPKITPIRRDDWKDHQFKEESVLKVYTTPAENVSTQSPKSYSHDFYINIDNKYLLHEQKTDPENKPLIEKQYTYGMVIVGLALLRQDAEIRRGNSGDSMESNGDRRSVEDRISDVSAALAPVFLPMVKTIGTLAQDES